MGRGVDETKDDRRAHVRWSPTVAEGLRSHDNALGLLRLVLAAAVIVSHGFPLSGAGEDPFTGLVKGQANLGGVAVFGFFAISGYLIAKSGARADVLTFLWHRVLRIFPAFWAVLLVGAVIVGPIAWLTMHRSLASYGAAEPSPIDYLLGNALLTIRQYGIGDIFLATPYGQTAGPVLNGSLWTLAHEWICYMIIAVLVVVGIMSRPRLARVIIPIGAVCMGAIQVGIVFFGVNIGAHVPLLGDPNRTQLMYVFLVGSTIAVFSRVLRLDDIAAIVAAIVVVATLAFGAFGVFGMPALAYLLLWAAARLPARLRRVGAVNDYSYGVYLYGFLVEQILAGLGVYHWGYLPYLLLSLVFSGACAWVSWHVLEKRALALKDRGPGRGIRYWWGRARSRRTRGPQGAAPSAVEETG